MINQIKKLLNEKLSNPLELIGELEDSVPKKLFLIAIPLISFIFTGFMLYQIYN